MSAHTAQATFYYMAAASVASALLAVTRKNPVHSMLWVLSLFMHVAGIFLLLGAEFLAAVMCTTVPWVLFLSFFTISLPPMGCSETAARPLDGLRRSGRGFVTPNLPGAPPEVVLRDPEQGSPWYDHPQPVFGRNPQ